MEAILNYMSTGRKESIAARLAAVGCAPFSAWSVFLYKRMAWCKVSWKLGYLICLTILAAIISAFFASAMICKHFNSPGVAAFSMIVAVLFAIFFLILVFSDERPQWLTTRNEHEVNYRVPGNLKHRMARTSAEFPEAIFEVDYLYEDPFLVARINGKRYTIAVWDEIGFSR